MVQNSGENFYWFSCSLCSNVLFCVIYIPPEGSIYRDINMFDNLESDILELSQSKNTQICLLGDINEAIPPSPHGVPRTSQFCSAYRVPFKILLAYQILFFRL